MWYNDDKFIEYKDANAKIFMIQQFNGLWHLQNLPVAAAKFILTTRKYFPTTRNYRIIKWQT